MKVMFKLVLLVITFFVSLNSQLFAGDITCPKKLDLKAIASELVHLELSGSRVSSFTHGHQCLKQENFKYTKAFLEPSSEGIDYTQFFVENRTDVTIEDVTLISDRSLTYRVNYSVLVVKKRSDKKKITVKSSLSFYLNRKLDAQKFSGCAVTHGEPDKIMTYLKCDK